MNPYDPPDTEAPEKRKQEIWPQDDIWLHPLEKMIAIVTVAVLVAMFFAGLIAAVLQMEW